jgi:P4 family phage/plasmid primase-like protien
LIVLIFGGSLVRASEVHRPIRSNGQGFRGGQAMKIFGTYALNFFDNGYSVIPVKQKNPEIKEWSKYCTTKATEQEMEAWCDLFAGHNIGLCLGEASGVVAFDYDYEGHDEKIISNLIKGILPPSPVQKTGKKGYTAFYRYSGQTNISVNRGKRRVFDFLSTGRQTVLPPSIHPMGMAYKWLTDVTLENVSPSELPELPESILNQLKNLLTSETDELFEEKIAIMIPRHDMLVGFIFRSMVRLSTEAEIAEALVEYDKNNFLSGIYEGKPAYLEDPKYYPNKNPLKAAKELVARVVKWATNKNKANGLTFELGKKSVVTTSSTGFHFVIEKVDKRTGEVKIIRKPDYYGFSEWCKQNIKAITSEDGQLAFYEDGLYHRKSDMALRHFLVKKSNFTVQPTEINNFLTILKAVTFEEFKPAPEGFINLKNGVLDVFNGVLLPHDPRHHFFYKLDLDYNKDATCPTWDKFLDQIFEGDKSLVKLIHQIFGYVIEGGYPYLQKAFVFYGDGRNGKSTILNILEKIVGRDLVSSVTLDVLSNSFAVYPLFFSKVNINEELVADDLNSTEFKNLITGGKIRGSKKYQDELILPCNARFVFATNNFPVFKDHSFGIERRLCIVPFNYRVPDEQIDTDLIHKLSNELSGILNKSLAEIVELRLTKKLVELDKIEQMRMEYKEDSDAVFNWLSEECEPDPESKITLTMAYHKFNEWCREEGRHYLSKRVFIKRVIMTHKSHPKFKVTEIFKKKSNSGWYLQGFSVTTKNQFFISE